ncbi:MAG: hypothetical protein GYA59_16630, partial [Chloroflexi bacterium]|nr:hypothetical protein [Chloroflexota bacterium]
METLPTDRVKPETHSSAWTRRVLIAVVVLYVGLLILAPLGALVVGAFGHGVLPVIQALRQPDVLAAFGRTLWIGLLVVVIHAVFGTLVAWVLARHRFAG